MINRLCFEVLFFLSIFYRSVFAVQTHLILFWGNYHYHKTIPSENYHCYHSFAWVFISTIHSYFTFVWLVVVLTFIFSFWHFKQRLQEARKRFDKAALVYDQVLLTEKISEGGELWIHRFTFLLLYVFSLSCIVYWIRNPFWCACNFLLWYKQLLTRFMELLL